MKRILILLALVLGIAVLASANGDKTCKAVKKDGTACKSTFIQSDGYCRSHSPNTPRCGAKCKDGHPCLWPVSKAGEHCKNHKN